MKTAVKDGQTLADMAVQEYGSLEAVVRLARDNGMSVSDTPRTGQELALHDSTYNRTMQDFCKVNEVSSATLRDTSGIPLRIFTEEFTTEFN